MNNSKFNIAVYILAKNEESNIGRCVSALASSGWPVHVLDSGSTDNTKEIVSEFDFVTFHDYDYINHCNSYNEICEKLGAAYKAVVVLDADMILSEDLQREIESMFVKCYASWSILYARIQMYTEGSVLKHASLCPAKPFVFKTGNAPFVSIGHAEKVRNGINCIFLKNNIMHDDRKCYSSFLQSQYRYSNNLVDRYYQGNVSLRDKFRFNSPLLVIAVPFFTFFFKRGFLDGRAGLIYALDRLIAESIMYRESVASRLKNNFKKASLKKG